MGQLCSKYEEYEPAPKSALVEWGSWITPIKLDSSNKYFKSRNKQVRVEADDPPQEWKVWTNGEFKFVLGILPPGQSVHRYLTAKTLWWPSKHVRVIRRGLRLRLNKMGEPRGDLGGDERVFQWQKDMLSSGKNSLMNSEGYYITVRKDGRLTLTDNKSTAVGWNFQVGDTSQV